MTTATTELTGETGMKYSKKRSQFYPTSILRYKAFLILKSGIRIGPTKVHMVIVKPCFRTRWANFRCCLVKWLAVAWCSCMLRACVLCQARLVLEHATAASEWTCEQNWFVGARDLWTWAGWCHAGRFELAKILSSMRCEYYLCKDMNAE